MLILNIQVSSSLFLPIKSLKLEKICLIFEKMENTPISHRILMKITSQIKHIRKPYCRGFKLLSTKM